MMVRWISQAHGYALHLLFDPNGESDSLWFCKKKKRIHSFIHLNPAWVTIDQVILHAQVSVSSMMFFQCSQIEHLPISCILDVPHSPPRFLICQYRIASDESIQNTFGSDLITTGLFTISIMHAVCQHEPV